MHRRRAVSAFIAFATITSGCNAILGIEGASFEPGTSENEGGTATPDGSNDPMRDAPIGDDARPDACAGVDLPNDPKNCGVCGRDCLGGKCMGGKCQLAPLVTDTKSDNHTRLLLDGTHVYWTNEITHELARIPKVGGNREVLFTATSAFGTQPVLTSSELVFTGTNGDRAFGCAKTGCADGGPRTLLSGTNPGAFATSPNGTILYFSNATGIGTCNMPVCDAVTFPPPAQMERIILFLAADNAGLVWTTLGISGQDAGSDLRSSDFVDSVYTLANFAPAYPNEVVMKGQRIFVNVPGAGIYMVPRNGGKAVEIAKGPGYQAGLAVDDKYVWFLQTGSGSKLQRCPLEGCTMPEDVLVGIDSPVALAVDDRFAYVYRSPLAAPGGGFLERLVK